jgi:uncharacterized membrane protein HdeD (DUF308 family)
MSPANPTLSDMQNAVRDTVRLHWQLFLTQGVIMVILGVLAVVWPPNVADDSQRPNPTKH